ncbi:hypothetical protein [Wolbachia endosymbiont of Ceratosolen solmsi]|nr:hypothetical protein [Wolbachia endosymbiont of Ceratosolen solmsi]
MLLFLSSQCLGTGMTKESYSDDTFFYLVWVMQEVYYNQALSVRK